MQHFKNMENAAMLLGQKIVGKINNVVGTGIEPIESNPTELGLHIYIDNESAREKIPETFLGHRVYISLIGTPKLTSDFR